MNMNSMLMSFWHSIHQIMQISQWKLCLGQINMEGKINDSREDFNHKFGIKMISFTKRSVYVSGAPDI